MNSKLILALSKQAADMLSTPVDGIKYMLNQDDPLDIQADIYGPVGTPYESGVFRCLLKVDSEFPNKPPKGYFLTKIFHPNVSDKGEICVNVLKKDWDSNNWSLKHILQVIRCLLIVPFPESSLNEEAGKEFMENYEEYVKHAKVFTNVYAKPKNTSMNASNENLNSKKDAKPSEAMPFSMISQNKAKLISPEGNEKCVGVNRTSDKKKWMKRL